MLFLYLQVYLQTAFSLIFLTIIFKTHTVSDFSFIFKFIFFTVVLKNRHHVKEFHSIFRISNIDFKYWILFTNLGKQLHVMSNLIKFFAEEIHVSMNHTFRDDLVVIRLRRFFNWFHLNLNCMKTAWTLIVEYCQIIIIRCHVWISWTNCLIEFDISNKEVCIENKTFNSIITVIFAPLSFSNFIKYWCENIDWISMFQRHI